MNKSYYQSQDLKKFKNISDWSPDLGKKFFDYYNSVFEEGNLSAREKSLIALAVAHTVQCPYCIDAYTQDGLERGIEKGEMMEALHVAAAIRGGASLVHGVQMMEVYEKRTM
ncbi:arsenosugar biosynthesis-associated peroxidase-like protein [Flavobacteriaceae bacterium]|jgi:alkylhydroperoxidase/carboxymuconolactone decarboxylase family protein|nr:arsenosugar biosynthesis-associated peroxidase-like protein [Flavobacteriaceae bacterium]